MHGLPFELKRAHLGAVAFGRNALDGIPGMTPARFDLLYAIRTTGWLPAPWRIPERIPPGLQQKRIVDLLGLHASTVSEMIARLVALGWVTKKKGTDRRTNYIELTNEGRAVIELAMKVVPHRKVHQTWLVGPRGFFRGGKGYGPGRRRARDALFSFARTVQGLADAFGRPIPQLVFDLPLGLCG